MGKSFRFSLFLAIALFSSSAFGQITSTIHGVVKDEAGALIPGATITAESPSLKRGQAVSVSDDQGRYQLVGLQPGVYRLTAQLSGFANEIITGVNLPLNTNVEVNIELRVASLQQEITVSANTSVVAQTQSDLQEQISNETIENIPLNGRQFLDLMTLVPATAPRPAVSDQGANITVFGERSISNSFLVDGLDNNNAYTRNFAEFFIQDAVQEFKVLLGGYEAEFGRASGAVANVVTRSGSNEFHGRVFGYFRDDSLDSSNINGQAAPELSRQEVGGTIGGPIWRDRTYFFEAFQYYREQRGINFDQSKLPKIISDGFFTPAFGGKEPFDLPPLDRRYTNFVRIDHQFNERNQIYGTVNINRGTNDNFLPDPNRGFAAPPPGTIVLPSIGSDLVQDTTSGNARYTTFFTDTTFLETSFRYANLVFEENLEKPADAEQLFPITTPFQVWMTNASPIAALERSLDQFQWSENLSYFAGGGKGGRHSLKFGVDLIRTDVDHTFISADQIIVGNPFLDANYQQIGYDISMQRSIRPILSANQTASFNNYDWALYVQDKWDVGSGLTLNLGLRYDYATLLTDSKNIAPRIGFAWDIGNRGKTVLRASYGRFYDQGVLEVAERTPSLGGVQYGTGSYQVVPRGGAFFRNPTYGALGFLQDSGTRWLANPKFYSYVIPAGVVRTSGNISITGMGQPYIIYELLGISVPDPKNPPVLKYGNIQSLTGGRLTPEQALAMINAFFPVNDISSGAVPSGRFVFLEETGSNSLNTGRPLAFAFTPLGVDALQVIQQPFESPYTDSFNIGIEQDLGGDISLGAQLFIRRSRDLLARRVSNLLDVPIAANCAGNTVDQGPCIRTVEHSGFLDSNVFTLTLQKRFNKNYSFLASYTYTDATDNFSTLRVPPASGETSFLINNKPELDEGRSLNSPEHVFVFNGSYHLPYGFDISGILNAQSGRPFNAAGLPLDSDGDQQFDNRLLGTEKGGYLSDKTFNVDLRLAKVFNFGERIRTTALIEFFNIFNRANPFKINNTCADSNGDNLPDAGGCGVAGGIVEPLHGREIQLGFRFDF